MEESKNLDDIPKEDLLSILKEKAKETLKLETKLKQLEQRYVQTFKEKTSINNDREVLHQFVNIVFSEEPFKISEKNIGEYDFKELQEKWKIRDELKMKTITTLWQDVCKEKADLEIKFKEKLQKEIVSMDSNNQNLIRNLQEQVKDHESNGIKLSKEIVQITSLLETKNQELEKSKQIRDEYSQIKAEMLIGELSLQKAQSHDSSDLSSRIQNSEKTNEILQVQRSLDLALQKIDILEQQLQVNERVGYNLNDSFDDEKVVVTSQVSSQTDQSYLRSIGNQHNHDILSEQGQEQNSIFHDSNSGQLESASNNGSGGAQKNESFDPNISNEYIKNVIFQFLMYLEGKKWSEANSLKSSILTILKVSKEQRDLLEETRVKASIWNRSINFVQEGIFWQPQEPNFNDGFQSLLIPQSSQSENLQ